jgi:antitoxin ParD1/3/4
MNISLPESPRAFVEEQVSQRRYGTTSEYVRDLIDATRTDSTSGASCSPTRPPSQARSLTTATSMSYATRRT